MTRLLLLLVLTGGAVGCTGVQPTGMMGRVWGSKPAEAKDVLPVETKDATAAAPAVPAGRPAPPAILITPGEVAPENPVAAATKLGNEIEYDLKNTPPAPKTPIVSRYKNGEKVQ